MSRRRGPRQSARATQPSAKSIRRYRAIPGHRRRCAAGDELFSNGHRAHGGSRRRCCSGSLSGSRRALTALTLKAHRSSCATGAAARRKCRMGCRTTKASSDPLQPGGRVVAVTRWRRLHPNRTAMERAASEARLAAPRCPSASPSRLTRPSACRLNTMRLRFASRPPAPYAARYLACHTASLLPCSTARAAIRRSPNGSYAGGGRLGLTLPLALP